MEVAGQVGISQAQVSRLEKSAIGQYPEGDPRVIRAGLPCIG